MQTELQIYCYTGCGTCRKALQWLNTQGISYHALPIREQPPTLTQLQGAFAQYGILRKLFNTSGADYKTMGLKNTIPQLSPDQAFDLLSTHGNLVKRPFVVLPQGGYLIGFSEEEWSASFGISRA